MSAICDRELEALLIAAERRGRCLLPGSKRVSTALSRRLAAGWDVRRTFSGMYARASWWKSLSRQQQALAVIRTLQDKHPSWFFCCESAGVVHGLPVDVRSVDCVHIVVRNRTHDSARASKIRRHFTKEARCVRVDGVNVTPLEVTAFDCMRHAEFPRALALADALVKLSHTSSTELCYRFLENHKGARGVRSAARALLYADSRSDNGGESFARGVMIKLGFARPQLQVPFPHPANDGTTYRVDFVWTREDGGIVLGELDGLSKYESSYDGNGPCTLQAFARERKRESMLSLYGAPIVRFSFADVLDEKRFGTLLKRFGVPQDNGMAALEARLARAKSVSAATFEVFQF